MTYRPYDALVANSASKGVKFRIQNSSGSSISAFQPVASDGSGKAKSIDVSIEAEAMKIIGVSAETIADGSYGYVYSQGKLENLTTSLTFGDYVYVSKTGSLTSTRPSEGVGGFVSGDFVVRVGLIVQNQAIPSQKDLLINIEIVGQI